MANYRRGGPILEIYQSRWHLFFTFLVVVLPFLYLFLFSHFASIELRDLFRDFAVSFWRLLIAYLIAVVLAWIGAVSFYRGRRSVIGLPIFDVLQSFPTFAVLPTVVYFWGASSFTVIFFLIITVVWPILFSIISSLKLIKRDWREAVQIAGLSGFDYLRLFLVPASLNGLITGSIIGLGEGWEALIATEIIVNLKDGLGGFFASFVRQPAITVFGVLGFLLLIFSINKLVWLPLLEWSHHKMEE